MHGGGKTLAEARERSPDVPPMVNMVFGGEGTQKSVAEANASCQGTLPTW